MVSEIKHRLSGLRLIERVAERAAGSKIGYFVSTVRNGWNNYNFIFYIGGISAILGSIFGWVGWVSIILTVLFFFYAGKFKEKVDKARKRKKALNKRKGTDRKEIE